MTKNTVVKDIASSNISPFFTGHTLQMVDVCVTIQSSIMVKGCLVGSLCSQENVERLAKKVLEASVVA